jgi:hypothetical protein
MAIDYFRPWEFIPPTCDYYGPSSVYPIYCTSQPWEKIGNTYINSDGQGNQYYISDRIAEKLYASRYGWPSAGDYYLDANDKCIKLAFDTVKEMHLLLTSVPPVKKDPPMQVPSAYIGKATITFQLKPCCQNWEPVAFRVPTIHEHYVGANGEIVQYNCASPCVNPRLIMKKIIVWRKPTLDDFAPSKLPRKALFEGHISSSPIEVVGIRTMGGVRNYALILKENCTSSQWDSYYVHD